MYRRLLYLRSLVIVKYIKEMKNALAIKNKYIIP